MFDVFVGLRSEVGSEAVGLIEADLHDSKLF